MATNLPKTISFGDEPWNEAPKVIPFGSEPQWNDEPLEKTPEIRDLTRGAINAAKTYGGDVLRQALGGAQYAAEGFKGLYSPPEVSGQDTVSASLGGGKAAGVAEGAAQVAQSGFKSIANLGKVVSGIGQTLFSPLAPLFNEGAKVGEKIGQKVPSDAAMKGEEFLQKYPEITKKAQELLDISSLAAPDIAARGAGAAVALKNKIPTPRLEFKVSIPDGILGYKDAKTKTWIQNDVDQLLNSTRGLTRANTIAKDSNVNLNKILAEPAIFRGLDVENGKINPDRAINVVDERIEPLMELKSRMLPELDRFVSPVRRESIMFRALDAIRGKLSPADELSLIERIKEQMAAVPEELKVSEIDILRAQMRKSARDARGQMKSDSEYAALEKAARDSVFDITDNLPVENAAEYVAMNDYIRQMIHTRDFLDETLRNQTVKGGRLGGYAMRLLGSLAGSTFGPAGVFGGHVLGGVFADIILNNQLGSSFKMKLISNLTDDPVIIRTAEALLNGLEQHQSNLPLLNEGTRIFMGAEERPQGQSGVQSISAPKGLPGQYPKGTPGGKGGKMFGTFLSDLPK